MKMDRELYGRIRANPREVRALIHEQLRQTPELFPTVTVILCSLHGFLKIGDHDDWLQNLLLSASLAGVHQRTVNPAESGGFSKHYLPLRDEHFDRVL